MVGSWYLELKRYLFAEENGFYVKSIDCKQEMREIDLTIKDAGKVFSNSEKVKKLKLIQSNLNKLLKKAEDNNLTKDVNRIKEAIADIDVFINAFAQIERLS